MNLTLEEQRKLTEFLGGNFKERRSLGVPIDFTDWRVRGRLIEKVGGIVVAGRLIDRYGYNDDENDICLAVLAYLEKP